MTKFLGMFMDGLECNALAPGSSNLSVFLEYQGQSRQVFRADRRAKEYGNLGHLVSREGLYVNLSLLGNEFANMRLELRHQHLIDYFSRVWLVLMSFGHDGADHLVTHGCQDTQDEVAATHGGIQVFCRPQGLIIHRRLRAGIDEEQNG